MIIKILTRIWMGFEVRSFIHMPMGYLFNGWRSFLEMLCSFLKKREILSQQIHQHSLLSSSQSSKPGVESSKVNGKSCRYAKAVLIKENQSLQETEARSSQAHSYVSVPDRQSMVQYWVQKNNEVLKEDFNNLWIVSRLFQFNNQKEIASTLEVYFQIKVIINPLFVENALIEINQGNLEDLIEVLGIWQQCGKLHLMF